MTFYDPLSDNTQHFGKQPQQAPAMWMLTVADLLSLILTFFVMLFAMNDVKQEQWKEVSQSLYQAAKRPIDEIVRPQGENKSTERITPAKGRNLPYLQYTMQNKMESLGLGYTFQLRQEQLVLSILLGDIAKDGSLSPEGITILERVGQVLAHQGNTLSVQTFADSGRAGVWEKALTLSADIRLILHQQGYEHPIAAEASLIKAGDSARVEIVIRETVANFLGNR